MPRNASGTYSLPSGNPVSSGTLIDSNWANNTLNDLANEVTDSLSRSAEGGMLAPLRLTDGVQATPSLAFTNEPSTGLYRAGTNEAWFVTGGNQVAKFTSTGMEGRFAAGAAATPSLAAYNDVNTGLWFPAADTLAASTGGSERMRLDSSGNLGIGTVSPVAYGGYTTLAINNATNGGLIDLLTNGTRVLTMYAGSTSVIGTANASNLSFITNNTERARLDTNGNLGIGTASPAHRLDVAYDANAVSSARVVNSNNGSSATATLRLDTAGGTWTINNGRNGGFLSFSDGGGERARFDNAGNLGIGTASPTHRLHVIGNTLVPISNSYFTFDVRFGIGSPDSDGLQIFSGDNIRLGGRSAGGVFTERMRITSDGNIVAGASAALATNATNGFLYVPTCAGTPTGTPTAITGMAPIVVNTTNNKLYFYSGGSWRDAGP